MNDEIRESKRQLISFYSFSVLIIIAFTAIDWTVTNIYNNALYGGVYSGEDTWMFYGYQFTIFIIVAPMILLFFIVIQLNYASKELNIEINGLHYFKFLRKLPKQKKYEIIFPALAFGLLFVFNFEDILWFRLFSGPNMSSVIDDFFGDMWWLDFHIGGLIGHLMGFGGATSLSVMVASSIGYALFSLLWYFLIKDKLLFVNLGICILYIFGVDIVFAIIPPPLPYLRITLLEILYFISFIWIIIKNTK